MRLFEALVRDHELQLPIPGAIHLQPVSHQPQQQAGAVDGERPRAPVPTDSSTIVPE